MAFIVGVLGLLQMAGGLLVYLASASAMHEILAATSFGAGVVCLALAAVINGLHGIENELKKRG